MPGAASDLLRPPPRLVSYEPPKRRVLRHTKTSVSPFQVESIAEHRRLNLGSHTSSQPSLNPGLQYLKSILYKDPSIAGSDVLRDHFHALEKRDEAEALEHARQREATARQMMMAADAESAAYNVFETKRLADVLAAYLTAQNESYLQQVQVRREYLYRDFQAWHDRSRVCDWTCEHCGAHNVRLLHRCEHCNEGHREVQETSLGLWELDRAGATSAFGAGQYRIDRVQSNSLGRDPFQFVVSEVPPRKWWQVPVLRRSPKDRTGLRIVLGQAEVIGTVDAAGLVIEWSDGMRWRRVHANNSTAQRRGIGGRPQVSTERRRQPTAARETPRAIAKQLERIDGHTSLDAVLTAMRQNNSAEVQTTGSLAICKAMLSGQDYAAVETEIFYRVSSALSIHRSVVTAVYAATSVLVTYLAMSAEAMVPCDLLRCIPLLICVACDHTAKSVVRRAIELLDIVVERGHGGFVHACTRHVASYRGHACPLSIELRIYLDSMQMHTLPDASLVAALGCVALGLL
ncbi:hypothetical protein SDRG_04121 [Saprolegnia diclina VS20]|uniref:RanBP2-type domain-containing protein n=1 Tax=Saprolegnia diclina (strain VS20) TaxID=1156394 RepID=T0QWL6_SAPDV|nr:hypothetical protein SDRG_04121 [Saprolegnia diclina VS20]EQC38410.1 hypothetical protein SDRG_04121 [Saprolegnia diclina VS20]|eukprot:XP_008608002.1 hypothetical protein SDRG_04121 [Saprolegnia diclina VS20]